MLLPGVLVAVLAVVPATPAHVPGEILIKFTPAMQHPDSTFDQALRLNRLPPLRRKPLLLLNPEPRLPDPREKAHADSIYRALNMHLWYIAYVDSAADIPALADLLKRHRLIDRADPNTIIRVNIAIPSPFDHDVRR